ncbi:helix-turn-helix transcriptional regulator [Pantoea sp. Tr-811]|uniref:helix-turn-helix domain-containing protein n=1 Tax=Pantoea sp. Tr-811 TaxID=2608361 RepID=UPI00142202F2|nr:helix-turn-helix transcriptional regulator [Pantoea sp. Tr-811]NIF28896.1 helix-turn-helix transcriptional regulator [Pantoea sp. Tr-811]
MALKSSFAVVLRALRNKRNISQREFADTTSRTYLSKLEGAKSSVTLDKLQQLSERLELSPLALLTLTVSEETGEPALKLVAELGAELRELARDGGLPGLNVLKPAEGDTIATPNRPRGSAQPRRHPPAGQTELPL